MTRDERNRRISELRGHQIENDECIYGCFTLQQKCVGTDWHADENWPTLLREMLQQGWCIDIEQFPGGLLVLVKRHREEIQTMVASNDPADHVTEAWLKWKDPQ